MEQKRTLEPGTQLALLVVTETEVRPVVLRLSKDAAVTGTASTLGRELEFREDPRRPYNAIVKGLYSEAGEAFRLGDWSTARRALERALELDPGQEQVLRLKERVRREESSGRHAKLVEKAERSWAEGKPEFALETLGQVLKADPGFAPALELRKRIEASESGKRVRELSRLMDAASRAESAGDRLEAERFYRQAMEMDPEYEEAVRGVRRVTAKAVEKPTAFAPAGAVTDRAEKADRAYNLGLDCYRKGDLDGAKRFWEETLSYQPGHFQAKRNLERLSKRDKSSDPRHEVTKTPR